MSITLKRDPYQKLCDKVHSRAMMLYRKGIITYSDIDTLETYIILNIAQRQSDMCNVSNTIIAEAIISSLDRIRRHHDDTYIDAAKHTIYLTAALLTLSYTVDDISTILGQSVDEITYAVDIIKDNDIISGIGGGLT